MMAVETYVSHILQRGTLYKAILQVFALNMKLHTDRCLPVTMVQSNQIVLYITLLVRAGYPSPPAGLVNRH
jgi:hypothetical protein